MRYRLIPTRGGGRNPTLHIHADSDDEALYLAQRNLGYGPALVCAAPEGGVVRRLEVVGAVPEPEKRRKR